MKTKTKKTTTKSPAKLSKAQTRVAIAKDVIKHLRSAQIGHDYCYGIIPNGMNLTDTDQLQKHVTKIAANCTVCAQGAMFISHFRLFNNITIGDLKQDGNAKPRPYRTNSLTISIAGDGVRRPLRKYFSNSQLALIEQYYEGWDGTPYRIRWENDKFRLKKIMQNVIDHNGTFKPERN